MNTRLKQFIEENIEWIEVASWTTILQKWYEVCSQSNFNRHKEADKDYTELVSVLNSADLHVDKEVETQVVESILTSIINELTIQNKDQTYISIDYIINDALRCSFGFTDAELIEMCIRIIKDKGLELIDLEGFFC